MLDYLLVNIICFPKRSTGKMTTGTAGYFPIHLCVRRVYLLVLFLLYLSNCITAKDFQPRINTSSKSELFEIAHEIKVLAPSHFPKPTRMLNDTAVPVVEPAFGKHRADQDVVMVRYRMCYLCAAG